MTTSSFNSYPVVDLDLLAEAAQTKRTDKDLRLAFWRLNAAACGGYLSRAFYSFREKPRAIVQGGSLAWMLLEKSIPGFNLPTVWEPDHQFGARNIFSASRHGVAGPASLEYDRLHAARVEWMQIDSLHSRTRLWDAVDGPLRNFHLDRVFTQAQDNAEGFDRLESLPARYGAAMICLTLSEVENLTGPAI